MNARVLLYIATALAVIQYCAHAFLFMTARPMRPEEKAVVDAMRSNRFKIGLSARSYWDFYFGYGLLVILTGLVEVVLLWQLAMIAEANPLLAHPLIAVLFLFNLAHAVLVWKYFALIAPVAFDIMIASLLGVSYLLL